MIAIARRLLNKTMIIGIDLGSTRLKETIISGGGDVLASRSNSYSAASAELLADPSNWTGENVLQVLAHQLSSLVGSIGRRTSDIQCLCISATAPDFWVLSGPLDRPSGPWCEGFSAVPSFESDDLSFTMAAAACDDPWRIEFCLRSVSARRALGPLPDGATYQTRHSWLFTLLTGAHELDSATAYELGAIFNPDTGDWITSVVEEVLGKVSMPKVNKAGQVVRRIKSDVAKKLGLSSETSVVLGSCDSLCSMISAGCCEKGDAFIYYGTYFCAATTNIDAYLNGDTNIPFEWNLSLPFAGRTLERLTCELYSSTTSESFAALSLDLREYANEAVIATILGRDRKPFIWENSTFSFSGVGPNFHRSDLPRALLREFGASLARTFPKPPNKAWAAGGAARSPEIVATVSSASNIDQYVIPGDFDAIGTALLALRAIDPSLAGRVVRTRRMSALRQMPIGY